MSLFSVFDPCSYFGISLNWMIMLMIYLFIPLKIYVINGNWLNIFKTIMFMSGKMFKEISFPNFLVIGYMVMGIFIYLGISNLLGLFPFVFVFTSHPIITLGMGVVMWMSFILMGWLKNFKSSAAHLVPEGSPIVLSPLMVIIEMISHLIRPFTLAIRLAANMMAGHLIVGLLSSISLISFYSFIFSVFLQNILMLLEFGVSIIQGFVFSVLLLLYVLEYY